MTESTLQTAQEKIDINLDEAFKGTSFESYEYAGFDDYDELHESLQEQITQDEVIYYSVAMNYLMENDSSLQESMALAHDMGYTCDNINSELLATLLQQGNLMTELSDIDFEDCFDEEDDEEEEPNVCKYCGENENDSADEDKLCGECSETFGHSFFSEL
jgi:hypothetical protein